MPEATTTEAPLTERELKHAVFMHADRKGVVTVLTQLDNGHRLKLRMTIAEACDLLARRSTTD